MGESSSVWFVAKTSKDTNTVRPYCAAYELKGKTFTTDIFTKFRQGRLFKEMSLYLSIYNSFL